MVTVKEALLAHTIFGVRRLRDERNIIAAQWRAAHHYLSVAYTIKSIATDQLVGLAKGLHDIPSEAANFVHVHGWNFSTRN
jgi:hypothetical protein